MIYEKGREGRINDVDDYDAFKHEAVKTERLHVPANDDDVKALCEVYADMSEDYDYEKGGRSLFYWSDALFTGDELYAALVEALRGYDYYSFNLDTVAALIDIFGHDAAIYQPARSYSVCIFIHTDGVNVDLTKLPRVGAGEMTIIAPNVWRLWWGEIPREIKRCQSC